MPIPRRSYETSSPARSSKKRFRRDVPVLGILSFLGWNLEGLAEMTNRTPAEVAMGGGIITIILGSIALMLFFNRNKQTPQIIIKEVVKEESNDKELVNEESIEGV